MYEINTCVTTTQLNDIIKMLKPCTVPRSHHFLFSRLFPQINY